MGNSVNRDGHWQTPERTGMPRRSRRQVRGCPHVGSGSQNQAKSRSSNRMNASRIAAVEYAPQYSSEYNK